MLHCRKSSQIVHRRHLPLQSSSAILRSTAKRPNSNFTLCSINIMEFRRMTGGSFLTAYLMPPFRLQLFGARQRHKLSSQHRPITATFSKTLRPGQLSTSLRDSQKKRPLNTFAPTPSVHSAPRPSHRKHKRQGQQPHSMGHRASLKVKPRQRR